MKKRMLYRALWLLLLLPMFSGCNDSDDLAGIFIGKTWKLTYITKVNGNKWYKFADVDGGNYEKYFNGSYVFTLTFNGEETDNTIKGTFVGAGSVEASGTWNANGKNQEFRMNVSAATATDSKDKLAAKIIEGMKNATSYEGSDSRNLFLRYQTDNGKENLCLVFAPVRN